MLPENIIAKTLSKILPGLLLFPLLTLNSAVAADFGRFMTTPKERKHLNELRYAEESVVVDITEDDVLLDEDDSVDDEVPAGSITAKGLVYRRNGKSSAWINDSNSYEGDVASNHVVVSGEGIQQNKLYIDLLGEEDKIQLKVGQTFEPEAKTLKDLTDQTSSVPPLPLETEPAVDDES